MSSRNERQAGGNNDGGTNSVCPVGFFAYGTLQRGQCRESAWPVKPTDVRDAWVHGQLFDGDDYPAMTEGTDKVWGQLWIFAASQMPLVTQAIDRVEGTNQPGHANLYDRVLVTVFGHQDEPLGSAFTYHYASRPEDAGFRRLEGHTVRWPPS